MKIQNVLQEGLSRFFLMYALVGKFYPKSLGKKSIELQDNL
jgi:hypothetical protein